MADHVQYHNPLKNPPLDHARGYFGIYTRKPIGTVEHGDRVWVITSAFRPRRYLLVQWFEVNDKEANMPDEENVVSGSHGKFFRSPVRIDDKEWFPDFLRNLGNFGRGFSPVTDRRFINGLEAAAGVLKADGAHVPGVQVDSTDSQRPLGQGFGDPVTNAETERAAIGVVTNEYVKKGWRVESVERENRGYDLRCLRRGEEEHVEVKGIQGSICSFMLTAKEHRVAHSDPSFVLVAVLNAKTAPSLRRFTATEFLAKCEFEPLTYRVFVKQK